MASRLARALLTDSRKVRVLTRDRFRPMNAASYAQRDLPDAAQRGLLGDQENRGTSRFVSLPDVRSVVQ